MVYAAGTSTDQISWNMQCTDPAGTTQTPQERVIENWDDAIQLHT